MNPKKEKVLVTDSVHECLIQGLESDGFEVIYDANIPRSDVLKEIDQYIGIVINSRMFMDRDMIDRAHKLRWISRLGSGKEIIDLEYCKEKKVAVITSPEGNANAVGEHALGMLLGVMNKIFLGDKRVRNFDWRREENRGMELEGKTVGIIGFGHTGRRFAEKLCGFDVEVLAYDKYKTNYVENLDFLKESSLDEVQRRSDIISLHVPLTAETAKMIDVSFLQRCKPGLILVNTSRGSVINTMDLIHALEEGQLAGAALDVFENEKPSTMKEDEREMYRRLFAFENTLFTPHVAGWTIESKRKLAETILRKIRNL